MKRKDLEQKLQQIADITGEATSETDAIEKGKDRYLYLEYASVYGGYRVVNVKLGSGAHAGAFDGNGCEARLTAKKMADRLDNILIGLQMAATSAK